MTSDLKHAVAALWGGDKSLHLGSVSARETQQQQFTPVLLQRSYWVECVCLIRVIRTSWLGQLSHAPTLPDCNFPWVNTSTGRAVGHMFAYQKVRPLRNSEIVEYHSLKILLPRGKSSPVVNTFLECTQETAVSRSSLDYSSNSCCTESRYQKAILAVNVHMHIQIGGETSCYSVATFSVTLDPCDTWWCLSSTVSIKLHQSYTEFMLHTEKLLERVIHLREHPSLKVVAGLHFVFVGVEKFICHFKLSYFILSTLAIFLFFLT